MGSTITGAQLRTDSISSSQWLSVSTFDLWALVFRSFDSITRHANWVIDMYQWLRRHWPTLCQTRSTCSRTKNGTHSIFSLQYCLLFCGWILMVIVLLLSGFGTFWLHGCCDWRDCWSWWSDIKSWWRRSWSSFQVSCRTWASPFASCASSVL